MAYFIPEMAELYDSWVLFGKLWKGIYLLRGRNVFKLLKIALWMVSKHWNARITSKYGIFWIIWIHWNTWQYLELLRNIWKYPKIPRNSLANGNYNATFIYLISLWASSIINEGLLCLNFAAFSLCFRVFQESWDEIVINYVMMKLFIIIYMLHFCHRLCENYKSNLT